jgi:hypothetical protein
MSAASCDGRHRWDVDHFIDLLDRKTNEVIRAGAISLHCRCGERVTIPNPAATPGPPPPHERTGGTRR